MGNTAYYKVKQAFFLGMIFWTALCLAGLEMAGAEPGGQVTAEKSDLVNAFLYFAAPDGIHLKAVPRQFPHGMDSHRLSRSLLEALMDGPSSSGSGLKRLFPEGCRVNALFITGQGDAYVDLGRAVDIAGPSDTITEYLAVYSLTNTLTVNIPLINRVKILMNGAEAASLGGHISLDTFFETNMLIVK